MADSSEKWDESRVKSLRGQSENLRLEFKRGALFDGSDKWISAISKAVSAFANTEGGDLVLGIPEEKSGKTAVAGEPDGIDDSLSLTKDRLIQTIQGNVYPCPTAIDADRVRLTSGKSVFVVHVPKGTTAYQAKDGVYYGRSGHGNHVLLDYDVRLRMAAGNVPRARLELTAGVVQPDSGRDRIPLYGFIHNNGATTIRKPFVVVEPLEAEMGQDRGPETPFVFAQHRAELPYAAVYPDMKFPIQPWDGRTAVICKHGASVRDGVAMISWTIYLDDAAPCRGAIDVGPIANQARKLV